MKALFLVFLCSCANVGLLSAQAALGVISGVGYGFRASREIKGAFAEKEREAEYKKQMAHYRAWVEGRQDDDATR